MTLEHRQPPEPSAHTALKTLLNSLDPLSVSQHLAFYELYEETPEGKQALLRAWKLLGGDEKNPGEKAKNLPKVDIQALISLVTRQPSDPVIELTLEQLEFVEEMGKHLGNRKLKGHSIWEKEAAITISNEETDLARSLLLFQFDEEKNKIRQYEASLDLMALQIQARLKESSTHEEKIKEINRFIFQEMQFRFPPHSLYAADIDLYTFLPSVLDSRQGVCLGVSILYLSLAQRLNLPLEIITPPGHIYVRYNDRKTLINIETTARGVDLPSELYLGINTRSLQQRTLKQVIGLAFMNQASVFWSKGDHIKTVALYEKALPFMKQDPSLKLFLGFNLIFTGNEEEGTKLLEGVRLLTLPEAVSQETLADDYLAGRVNAEGVKAIFLPVDETRASIVKKQQELETLVKAYPFYRAGLLQLATTWLQLGRTSEAQEVLMRYHKIDSTSSIVEYYLTALCLERLDYTQAWQHLTRTEALLQARNHRPKVLFSIKETLLRICPEP